LWRLAHRHRDRNNQRDNNFGDHLPAVRHPRARFAHLRRFQWSCRKSKPTLVETDRNRGGLVVRSSGVRGETEWVKNVRANPHVKLTKSGVTDYVATETPVEARKRIVEAYKATASKATHRLFRQLPEDADHPVFALTPLLQPSGEMSRRADGNGRLPPNGL
jgi:hypothetical protein